MNKKFLPSAGIIVVTIILVTINEFTDLTFIKDYAFILIIAGMLFGVWLTKLSDRTKGKNE